MAHKLEDKTGKKHPERQEGLLNYARPEMINGGECTERHCLYRERQAHRDRLVVTADGLILTCAHVLGSSMPEKARVVFLGSGEEREATVLAEGWHGVEAEDVAVLRVCGALPDGVQPLPLGDRFFVRPHAKGHEVRRATQSPRLRP